MRNERLFFFALMVLVAVSGLTVCAETGAAKPEAKEISVKLAIQVGDKIFTAVLYDTETTAAFLRKLPMTLDMSELHGNEKYFYLSDRLPADSLHAGSIKSGDLMLYGSDCIVLFYESCFSSYRYTKLGYITDVTGLASALGKGNVTVSFSVVK